MNTQFTLSGDNFLTNISRATERPKLLERTIKLGAAEAVTIETLPGVVRAVAFKSSGAITISVTAEGNDIPHSGGPGIFPILSTTDEFTITNNASTETTVTVVIF